MCNVLDLEGPGEHVPPQTSFFPRYGGSVAATVAGKERILGPQAPVPSLGSLGALAGSVSIATASNNVLYSCSSMRCSS